MFPVLLPEISRLISQKMVMIPVCLGLGIALYFSWPTEPSLIRPLLLALVFGACAGLSASIDRTGQAGFLVAALIFAALFWGAVGFAAAKIRAVTVAAPMIEAPLGPTSITGRITALEHLEGRQGARLILSDLTIRDLTPATTPKTIRLNLRKGGRDLNLGDYIRVLAKIEPASPPTTPDGFDFRRHAYFKQIGGYGYVLGTPKVIEPQALGLLSAEATANADDPGALDGMRPSAQGRGSISDFFENTRNAITARVNDTLPPERAGMVAALLTGERAAINEQDWQALRDSGLAHLLAISGANVDMVALIVFFVARLIMAAFPMFTERHPIKKYAAVIAFFAALFYVLLILPSTPTLRALLMVTIVLLAVLLDRSPISLRLVCASAVIILLIQPEQLLSPSFQLSFAAVTALVAVFEIAAPYLKRMHRDATAVKRLLMYIIGVCATTVIATIATAPISLYHFQTLALYGVIANAVAVPIMTFLIMPLAILSYPLMMIGMDASTLWIIGVLCDFILDIAHATAQLPGARFTPPAVPFVAFAFIIVAGLMACLLVGRLRALAVLPLLAAVVVVAVYPRPSAAVLADGRVIMTRDAGGVITTNTKRFARRQQADWVRYWGGDDIKGAVVNRNLVVPAGAWGPSPVALYGEDQSVAVPVSSRGKGRLWQ